MAWIIVLTLEQPMDKIYPQLFFDCMSHGCIIESGNSDFRGPPLIPMKAAQWHVEEKWLDFPGLKIPGSDASLGPRKTHTSDSSSSSVCNSSRAGYFWFPAPKTRTGIK